MWSMEAPDNKQSASSPNLTKSVTITPGALAKTITASPLVPIVSTAGMAAITGIGSHQCYKIAQMLEPRLYEKVIDITQYAVDILIQNPALLKMLALKYERRVLTSDEMEKAVSLLHEFNNLIHKASPALYFATGALAATSVLYAYHAVKNSYKFVQSPSTTISSQSVITLSPPFITLSPEKKVLLNMGCWGAATTIAGITTYTCYKVDNLFEFDTWDIALNFLESVMKDLHDNPKVLNLLRWWYNEDALQIEYFEKTGELVTQGRTLLEKAPSGIQIAKGAFAALTLYGVYKMVICGYDYLKYKFREPSQLP
jgi:hypothetical protein